MDNNIEVADFKAAPVDTASGDTLSIVRSAGLLVAKLWQADGEIRQYDDAKYFTLREARVSGIDELSALLSELESDPHACVIRGRYVGDEVAKEREPKDFKSGKVLRRNTCFEDQKLHTILIEIDGFQPERDPIADPEGAIDEFIRDELPKEFFSASYHWQLSSSAGHPSKGNSLRAHVWFWLSAPRTSEELKTWARALNLKIDKAVFQKIQAHYTARPVFEKGVKDPVRLRSGFVQGFISDAVDLEIDPVLREWEEKKAREAEQAAERRAERASRKRREGGSPIERFNDTHPLEQLLEEYGFEDKGSGIDWRSPNQTSGSYALQIREDEHGNQFWISLSGSDAEAGLGHETTNGHRTGDAFDLYTFHEHDNDREAALQAWRDEETADKFDDLDPDDVAEAGAGAGAGAVGGRFAKVQAAELLKRPRPAWLIEDMIPQAELVVVYGPSGSGKSFIMLDLMMSIARGIPWRGLDCVEGPVLYICAEGSGGFRNRLEAYAHHHQVDLPAVPFWVIERPPNFLMKDDMKAVLQTAKDGEGSSIIVVDTFAKVTPGANENAGEDMGKALDNCRRLSEATGAVVVLVHHTGKDVDRGARGWSGIRAAADAEFEVAHDSATGKRWLANTKQKDGEDGGRWGFCLAKVSLGLTEKGKEITSCVTIEDPSVGTGAVVRGKGKDAGRKLGKWETVVLEAFNELQLGGDVLHSELIIVASKKREGHTIKTAKFAAGRAIESLEKRKILVVRDGYVFEEVD